MSTQPPKYPRGGSGDDADDAGDDHGENTDRQRHLAAVQDP